jgi:hypothetical protein
MTANRRLPAFGKSPATSHPSRRCPGEPLYLITYDYRDRAIGRCRNRRSVAEPAVPP